MIFDTDVLIWLERGNAKAAQAITVAEIRLISVQTYMELLQGSKSQQEVRIIKDFLSQMDFMILPLTENIGHRASIYIEEHAAASGLRAGDALIAATAVENNIALMSGNHKHFRSIRDLKIKPFSP